MKAILEFNLEDIDDEIAHFRALKALDLALALSEIAKILRSIDKYGDRGPLTREEFYSLLESGNIDLDALLN